MSKKNKLTYEEEYEILIDRMRAESMQPENDKERKLAKEHIKKAEEYRKTHNK